MPHILYISFDGVLEPLGRSQITQLLHRLTKWDVASFSLISFEKSTELGNVTRLRAQLAEFAAFGVDWHFSAYQSGAKGILGNIAHAGELALEIHERRTIDLVHARSYVAAGVANSFQRLSGVPYLFDFRGYWVDERIDEGLWFTGPISIRLGRMVERRLFQDALGIVSLATPAADDILNGKFGAWAGPIGVIPTCVDDDTFVLKPKPELKPTSLKGKLVIGFVGSLNVSYRVGESLQLFRKIRALRSDAHLLCLTRQVDELTGLLKEVGITDFTAVSVNHEEMATWMSYIEWGLLLLNEPVAKRGSMPTKLGEYFAAGVRPIQYGCNSEVSQWVNMASSGLVLDSTDESELEKAAEFIASSTTTVQMLEFARELTMPHFSMDAGARHYQDLYKELLK